MNVVIYKRTDPKCGKCYDVHVINDPNVASNFHAGGMPSEWVVLACASEAQMKAKFPQLVMADGTKRFDTTADAKSQKTDADVDVRIVRNAEVAENEVTENKS